MRKLLLILGCIITATSINAQYNTNGLYNNHFTFDKAAFIPSKLGDNNARFEMRILPNTYLYAGNTFMSIDDILYPTTSRINEIVDDASDANRIGVGTEAPWFAFSYKIKSNDKELLTVGLTSKARAFSNTSLGGNMLRLLWRGNKQFAGQTVDLGKFELNAFAATEIGLTLAVPFKIGNTNIRGGASFKYLMAYGGIDLPQATSTITTGVDGRYVNMDLNYEINLANFDSDEGLPGKGIAFDLGATVNVGESMQVSASVLDIGSINYSKNTTSYQFTGDMNFEGIEMDNLFENNSLKIDSAFIEQFKVNKDSGQAFSIALPTRLVVQVEKHIGGTTKKGQDYIKHSMYLTYIQGFNNSAGGTTNPYASLGYAYSLKELINIGPTVNYGGYSGLGAGMFLSVKAGPFRMGVGSNSIFSYFLFPKSARGIDASFTTAWVFGKQKEKGFEEFKDFKAPEEIDTSKRKSKKELKKAIETKE